MCIHRQSASWNPSTSHNIWTLLEQDLRSKFNSLLLTKDPTPAPDVSQSYFPTFNLWGGIDAETKDSPEGFLRESWNGFGLERTLKLTQGQGHLPLEISPSSIRTNHTDAPQELQPVPRLSSSQHCPSALLLPSCQITQQAISIPHLCLARLNKSVCQLQRF